MEEEIKNFLRVELVLSYVGMLMGATGLSKIEDREERDRKAIAQNEKMVDEFIYALDKKGYAIVKKERSYEELLKSQ